MSKKTNKQKRIAIQLFGYLRTFEYTYKKFFENIVMPQRQNGYIVDIFIHTWDTTNTTDKSCNGHSKQKTIKNVSDKQLQKIKKIYNPVSILIEKQHDVCGPNIYHIGCSTLFNREINVEYRRAYNQYYTMYRVNKLRCEYEKQHGIKYDYIIETRPDILFYKTFDIDYALKQIDFYDKYRYSTYNIHDTNKNFPILVGSSIDDWPGHMFVAPETIVANDTFMVSTPITMNKSMSLFINLDKELKYGFFNHECFFMRYVQKQHITPIILGYMEKRDYKIIRVKKINLYSNIMRLIRV